MCAEVILGMTLELYRMLRTFSCYRPCQTGTSGNVSPLKWSLNSPAQKSTRHIKSAGLAGCAARQHLPHLNRALGRLDAKQVALIGWVCAIKTEYVAAQVFLDEEHERSETSPNDNNNYTLGKMGKHNVVIAVLPSGEYGISTAAVVARDMLSSFPNVRIGLMVGIGGGAPNQKHDIRLGDIVVSAPSGGESGVLQYDFGDTIQGQSFKTTGFLHQAPMVLRTAVSGLQTQCEMKGHQLEKAINNALQAYPRLQKKYRRPGQATDRLYQRDVVHASGPEGSCDIMCGSGPSSLVFRKQRTEDYDGPTIHYGLIASANNLMKNALLRDALAEEKDVLCFEMEAAGLMNHFPCLVICGICDYADSHKNKEWQGYAAMAATAYTKELLEHISPSRVEAEKTIVDVLAGG